MARAGFHEASLLPDRTPGAGARSWKWDRSLGRGTQETSCGDGAARAVNLDVVAVFFFFYFLLIPSRSRKKEILVDAFMPSLELCGLEGHSHGGEWIGVVAAADRATETSTTRAFVRFRRAPPCVLATIRRPAGRSIDPAALHAMRSIFSPRHVYIYICLAVASALLHLGWGWTGPGRAHERACSDRSRARRRNGLPTSLAACLPALQMTKRKCMRHAGPPPAILSYFLTHVN